MDSEGTIRHPMEAKSIPKLLLQYGATTFIALALNSLYSLVDALFVGRGVGVDALGGITAVVPFTMLQGAISTMLGGGAAILVSVCLGRKQPERAGSIVATAAVTFWITALTVTALGLIFLDPFLSLLGVAEGLLPYAKPYLKILLIGNVFSTGFSAVMRAEGKMVYALLQWVIPLSINIVLDGVFVLVLNMGVVGAALATVIGQFVGAMSAIVFFVKFSSIQWKGARLNKKDLLEVTKSGLPSLVQSGTLAVGFAFLNHVLKLVGGEGLQNVYAAMSRLFMFAVVPFMALSQALQPIVGYYFGGGKTNQVNQATKTAILFCLVVSVVLVLVAELIPKQLLWLQTDDEAVLQAAVPAFRLVIASLPLYFLPLIVGTLMQSIQKRVTASVLYALSYLFIAPCAYLLSLTHHPTAIWLSFLVAGGIASLIALAVLLGHKKRFQTKKISTEQA